MEAVGAIFGLLGLISLFAIIKPFGPYKKRWQALIGGLLLFVLGGALMPDTPSQSVDPSPPAAPSDSSQGLASQSLPAMPTEPRTRWMYQTSRDEMRNANTNVACVESTNELRFDFPYQGGSQAEICFRQSPQHGFDAWVRIERGQFTCFLDCSVRVKFDDGEVRSFSAGGAADGSSDIIFISNASRFLSGVKRASRVIVEAEFYQAGSRQMVFEDAQGLEWPRPADSP